MRALRAAIANVYRRRGRNRAETACQAICSVRFLLLSFHRPPSIILLLCVNEGSVVSNVLELAHRQNSP